MTYGRELYLRLGGGTDSPLSIERQTELVGHQDPLAPIAFGGIESVDLKDPLPRSYGGMIVNGVRIRDPFENPRPFFPPVWGIPDSPIIEQTPEGPIAVDGPTPDFYVDPALPMPSFPPINFPPMTGQQVAPIFGYYCPPIPTAPVAFGYGQSGPPDVDLGEYGMRGIGWNQTTGDVYLINEGLSIGRANDLDYALMQGRTWFGGPVDLY